MVVPVVVAVALTSYMWSAFLVFAVECLKRICSLFGRACDGRTSHLSLLRARVFTMLTGYDRMFKYHFKSMSHLAILYFQECPGAFACIGRVAGRGTVACPPVPLGVAQICCVFQLVLFPVRPRLFPPAPRSPQWLPRTPWGAPKSNAHTFVQRAKTFVNICSTC